MTTVCEPKETRSPGRTTCGRVTIQPLIRVPFVDPRSVRTHPSGPRLSRAWLRDTVRFENVRSHQGFRPSQYARSPSVGRDSRARRGCCQACRTRRSHKDKARTRRTMASSRRDCPGRSRTRSARSSRLGLRRASSRRRTKESLLSRPWTAASRSSRNARSRSASETRTGGNVPPVLLMARNVSRSMPGVHACRSCAPAFGEPAHHGGTGLSTGGYLCALAGGLGSWPAAL